MNYFLRIHHPNLTSGNKRHITTAPGECYLFFYSIIVTIVMTL